MATRHLGEMETEILRVVTRLLHDRFPDLDLVNGWDHADAIAGGEARDALISNWTAAGDAYVGAYFDRGNRYFAVTLETDRIERDGKWAARVFKTALGGGDGTVEVEEDLFVCATLDEFCMGITRCLSSWRKPFLIHMSEDCTSFEALSPEDRRLLGAEGITVSNVVGEVMAENEMHALEVFRGKGPRSNAFHDMVDRGIVALPTSPRP